MIILIKTNCFKSYIKDIQATSKIGPAINNTAYLSIICETDF